VARPVPNPPAATAPDPAPTPDDLLRAEVGFRCRRAANPVPTLMPPASRSCGRRRRRAKAIELVERIADEESLDVLGWRPVRSGGHRGGRAEARDR